MPSVPSFILQPKSLARSRTSTFNYVDKLYSLQTWPTNNLKMGQSLKLELLSEKILPHTANAQLIKYCPSMDLVALGSTDQQVLIYRLNGQRVYGTTQKSGNLRVESIRWKPNGIVTTVDGRAAQT